MKEEPPSSTYDHRTILSGMTGTGKFRAVFIEGQSNQNKAKKLAELGTAIVRNEPSTFCALMDGAKISTPYEWCSQFARTLRTMNGAEPMALAKFAMAVGKSLIPFKPGGAESKPEEEANEKVIANLVKHFEGLVDHLPKGRNSPKLVIIFDKFDSLNEEMLKWMSSVLNQAFRKSKSFEPCRFIFSAGKRTKAIDDFFNRFGFEHVHAFNVGSKDADVIVPETEKVTSEAKHSQPHSDPTPAKPKELESTSKSRVTSDSLKDTRLSEATNLLAPFDEVSRGYLTLASYPARISRYTLEFFTDGRTAALAFNWLKRKPEFCELQSNGELVLLDKFKKLLRMHHASVDSNQAEQWVTLASILDAFMEIFPNYSMHWIPVNLQLFSWFNGDLLNRIFDEEQVSQVHELIRSNENVFVKESERMSLSSEAKNLTRRLLDVSHLEVMPGLLSKARELWTLDLEKFSKKKSRMDLEKKSFRQDIEDAEGEISNLNEHRGKLLGEFQRPGSLKPEKTFSFSSSKLLIIIGLGTVGLSLMSENLGSYHAACGLGLALFGFFWPMVEIKSPVGAAAIANSPLSLDAQKRSLDHRLSNLQNRLKVMKANLTEVDAQLDKMGSGWDEPYVELEEMAED